jgi:hypothetical protein
LGTDERERLRSRLKMRLAGVGVDGPIRLSARAWAVRGIVSKRQRRIIFDL